MSVLMILERDEEAYQVLRDLQKIRRQFYAELVKSWPRRTERNNGMKHDGLKRLIRILRIVKVR